MTPLLKSLIAAELRHLNPKIDALDALLLLIGKDVRRSDDDEIEVVNSAGNVRVAMDGAKVRNMRLDEYLNELKAERPSLFEQPSPEPSNRNEPAGNPWAKETYNLTQQMILLRTQPKLAARLKREAEQPATERAKNPWSKEGWNLTRQMVMIRDDLTSAFALARQAGYPRPPGLPKE